MKFKQFFVDNKSKIKGFFESLIYIFICLFMLLCSFSFGYNLRDNLDTPEEPNKKELVNRKEANNILPSNFDFQVSSSYTDEYSLVDSIYYGGSGNLKVKFYSDINLLNDCFRLHYILGLVFPNNNEYFYIGVDLPYIDIYYRDLMPGFNPYNLDSPLSLSLFASGYSLPFAPEGSDYLTWQFDIEYEFEIIFGDYTFYYYFVPLINVEILDLVADGVWSSNQNIWIQYFRDLQMDDDYDTLKDSSYIYSGSNPLYYFNKVNDNVLSLLNGNFLSVENLEDLYFYFSDTSEYSYTDLVNSDFELNRFLKGNYLDIEYLRNYFNGGDFSGLTIDEVNISFKLIVLPIKDFTFSLNSFSPIKSYEIWLDNDGLSPVNKVSISSNGDYYNYDISEDFYSLSFFTDMFYDSNVKKLYVESSAYSQGFSNGLTEGKDIGYSNGYDVGYNEGKDIGYEEGFTDGKFENNAILKPFELMIKGVEPVIVVLSSEIAPGITIGTIALIPLAVTMIVFLLKGLVL